MDSVDILIDEVRKCINKPRKQSTLIQTIREWHMLCSCMDLIEDAELAIQSYRNHEFPADDGMKYIFVYGVLQALFSQQDAVQNLCEALGFPYEADPNLKLVRDVRNDSIGHPTKRGKGARESFHFISRVTMCKEGFQLLSEASDRTKSTFKDISIIDLIEKQQNRLCVVLADIVEKLRQEEEAHKAMYKDDRLQDVFPGSLSCYFSKLFEATHGNIPGPLGAMHMKLIVDVLQKLKEKMVKRGIQKAYEGFNYTFDQLEYPISELEKFFRNDEGCLLTEKGAYIFAYYVQKEFEELQIMAKEVDEEYQEGPESTT